ncbi:MAG TPA: nuclear transport factor 2 family protein [Longimicrobium sp.]
MKQVSLAEAPEELRTAFAEGDPASAGKEHEGTNVELLGRMVAAIAAGRFDELRGFLAPEATFELAMPARFPWVRRAAGAEDVIAAIAANFGQVRDQRSEPLALVAQGDDVMVMARETGRLAETGEPYEVLLAQHYSFRDGRLAGFRSVVAEAGEPAYADT